MARKMMSVAVLCGLFCLSAGAADKSFEVLGIGGAGGMYTPAISPQDPNLIFISCDMSGSYRSLDGGKHWEMIHHGQLKNSLTCRPLFVKDAVIWVNGGTPKISRDKGATWTPVVEGKTPWNGEVTNMETDPSDNSVLLFGTAGELWRSADGGKTWKLSKSGKVQSILGLGKKFYVAMDTKLLISSDKGETWEELAVPEAKGQKFLSLAGGIADGATVLYGAVEKECLLQSLDEGKTWKAVEAYPCGTTEVRMTPNQTKVAYIVQQGRKFVLQTVDGGKTWDYSFKMKRINGQAANVELSWVQTELAWGYGIMPLGLGVSQTDPNVVMVSTQGDFYITRDGGKTWQQLMNIAHGVLPGDPGRRYECNGLEVTTCYAYLFDPLIKDRRYIAYTDIGFSRSVDAGKTWSPAAKGCPWGNTFYQVVFDPTIKGKMYAATSGRHDIPQWTNTDKRPVPGNGGVCVSDDGAVTWKVLGTGLPNLPCTSVCIDPKSPKGNLTLYATLYEGGCYKSTDNGQTWVNKSNGLGNPGNMHAFQVSVHPKTGAIYCSITACRVGARDFPVAGGLWKSTDGGDNWTDLTKALDLRWPASFAVHPENPDVIYLTAATFPNGSQGGIYGTTGGGKTWKRLMQDADFAKSGGSSFVHCLYVNLHPAKPDYVYIGTTSHGLWVSQDAGQTWKRFEKLPFTSASNLTFDPANPEIMYVSTFGGGIWKGNYLP